MLSGLERRVQQLEEQQLQLLSPMSMLVREQILVLTSCITAFMLGGIWNSRTITRPRESS